MILKHVILTQSLAPETANVAKAGRYHSFTIILKYMEFIRTRTEPLGRMKNKNV
jgi:hypothetical protein